MSIALPSDEGPALSLSTIVRRSVWFGMLPMLRKLAVRSRRRLLSLAAPVWLLAIGRLANFGPLMSARPACAAWQAQVL